MARLSINEMTTYRWSFEEDVARYKAAGVAGIGVWRQKLSDFGEERGVELLADSGLQVSNVLWAGGFTGSEGRNFRESLEDARDALRLCGALRADCLVLYSGSRSGHTHNHARRLVRDALRELAPMAEDLHVALALEPLDTACAGECTFLTDLDETLTVLQSVGSPAAKLVFDTYHFGHAAAVRDRLPELAPWIGVVHLGDGRELPRAEQNRCLLGDGCVPVGEIVQRLESAGYKGFYDVELLGEEVESADYEQVIRHSQRTFAQWLELCGC